MIAGGAPARYAHLITPFHKLYFYHHNVGMEEKQTTVRCFANETDGGKSCGIRAMTRETGCRGLYLHGHRCEVQPPAITLEYLSSSGARDGGIHEVTDRVERGPHLRRVQPVSSLGKN